MALTIGQTGNLHDPTKGITWQQGPYRITRLRPDGTIDVESTRTVTDESRPHLGRVSHPLSESKGVPISWFTPI